MNDWPAHNRRTGRAVLTVLIAIVALGGGLAGGYWFSRHSTPTTTASGATGSAETMYTCGMHPNVVQVGPGTCPICEMKLTPVKSDTAESDEEPSGPEQRRVLYWRAPMDPKYTSDKPGKSPMGMDLVPVYAEAGETITGNTITITPETVQNMGVRTARLQRGPLTRVIRTLGQLEYDERKVGFVTTRFTGWIKKLNVDETGQSVAKGQALFDIYSPEIYEAQSAYLAALRFQPVIGAGSQAWAQKEAERNVAMAREKLRLFDISADQIDELKRTRKIRETLTIRSAFDGVVTDKMALDGMYVNPGMHLYTIADLSTIWAQVSIYEYQLPWVRVGQDATLELPYFPGETFRGKVVYIYPYLSEATRDTKIRLEFDNADGKLKPKMVANVRLEAHLADDALLIPREAYIDSGQRKVTFVDRGRGRFEPRQIQTGVEAEGGMVEVLGGLDEGDVVVTSGQFLLDAESKIKEAMAKMMQARRVASAQKAGVAQAQPAADHKHETVPETPSGTLPVGTRYACPMEKHPAEKDPAKQGAYFATEPGRCPWCNMMLKPVEELEWARLRKDATGADVAYTCPDHPEVFSSAPDTCPRDGKALEPFKAIYTCRLPEHAHIIRLTAGACPECDQALVAYRGPWLNAGLAHLATPTPTPPAGSGAYHCPTHPLVQSDQPGHCPLCAARLEPARAAAQRTDEPTTQPVASDGPYACSMHPNVRTDRPGPCPVCNMRLVPAESTVAPTSAPAHIQQAVNHITEHYLAMRTLFAADTETGLGANALGVAQAVETLLEHVEDSESDVDQKSRESARRIRRAALKMTGRDLTTDRAHFADLSEAYIRLLDSARPDRQPWPELTIYRCPMAHAEWVQAGDEMGNPYYGFKMLKCGNAKGVK